MSQDGRWTWSSEGYTCSHPPPCPAPKSEPNLHHSQLPSPPTQTQLSLTLSSQPYNFASSYALQQTSIWRRIMPVIPCSRMRLPCTLIVKTTIQTDSLRPPPYTTYPQTPRARRRWTNSNQTRSRTKQPASLLRKRHREKESGNASQEHPYFPFLESRI